MSEKKLENIENSFVKIGILIASAALLLQVKYQDRLTALFGLILSFLVLFYAFVLIISGILDEYKEKLEVLYNSFKIVDYITKWCIAFFAFMLLCFFYKGIVRCFVFPMLYFFIILILAYTNEKIKGTKEVKKIILIVSCIFAIVLALILFFIPLNFNSINLEPYLYHQTNADNQISGISPQGV